MNPVEIEQDIRRLEGMLGGGVVGSNGIGTRGLPSGDCVHAGSGSGGTEPEIVVERRVVGADGRVYVEGPKETKYSS